MDCSLPGSSVHGIFQARVLEWGAIALRLIHVLYSRNQHNIVKQFVVQSLSCLQLFVNPWPHQAALSFTISWNLLRLISIELVRPSNHLILCCPLFLLPSILPSIKVFSNESTLHIRWPKYWSLGFSISPSSSGLIFFRITGLIFCPRKAQETSTTPQFKSINSSALSLLYGSTLTSIHDYWKNHNFDYIGPLLAK